MQGFAGVTPMDSRTAGVTVQLVEPETVPRVAVTVTGPVLSADPNPS